MILFSIELYKHLQTSQSVVILGDESFYNGASLVTDPVYIVSNIS